jgi:imidazolonepropionase-like amidohydrolase
LAQPWPHGHLDLLLLPHAEHHLRWTGRGAAGGAARGPQGCLPHQGHAERRSPRRPTESIRRAAVEEAEAAGLYVAGHAYTAQAVNRGLQCGVRSIEHGNLMDQSSVELFKSSGAFYVPTLATYSALAERGLQFGLPEHSHRKVFGVLDSGLRALDLAHRSGVPIVYGTDLLGGMHEDQLTEFTIRSQVQPAAEIIRSATTIAARLLRMEGVIGVVKPGATADLLVVDGDPLRDVNVLTDPARNLRLIMVRGRIARDDLEG